MERFGHEGSVATVAFPKFEEKYLIESKKNIQFRSMEKCVSRLNCL